MSERIDKSEEQWQAVLDPDAYKVLRCAGTEAPFTGALLDEKRPGVFCCRGCEAQLFDATTKFDSGTGWPSFTDPLVAEAVELRTDRTYGILATEVLCARCGGHLGHVFPDGPGPGGRRFCINSVALDFQPGDDPGE